MPKGQLGSHQTSKGLEGSFSGGILFGVSKCFLRNRHAPLGFKRSTNFQYGENNAAHVLESKDPITSAHALFAGEKEPSLWLEPLSSSFFLKAFYECLRVQWALHKSGTN